MRQKKLYLMKLFGNRRKTTKNRQKLSESLTRDKESSYQRGLGGISWDEKN